MTLAMTQAEFDAVREYLDTDEFKRRRIRLERVLETKTLTTRQVAKILGLSVHVLVGLMAAFEMWQAVKPTLGTMH
jgi:transposase